MKVFEERLVSEYDELTERIGKLTTFMKGEEFQNLSIEMHEHLSMQLNAMQMYHFHLRKRLILLDILKYTEFKI
jgi:hypothetical protein